MAPVLRPPCPSWQRTCVLPGRPVPMVPRIPAGRAPNLREKSPMPEFDTGAIVLVSITLFAAFVNGALGYGFSSLTVPIALFFYANRILNPALVMIEVVINIFVLIMNRDSVPAVWKRVYPILFGLLPGILLGSYLLASLHPAW